MLPNTVMNQAYFPPKVPFTTFQDVLFQIFLGFPRQLFDFLLQVSNGC